MRQRGAGYVSSLIRTANFDVDYVYSIRTVSTNFGFAFGSQSEETSSNATPTRAIDEPRAKRRKTILSNESMTSEAAVFKSVKAESVKRATKSRRRFPLDDDDVRTQPEPIADDDSFVAVLGNKKTLNKKAKIKSKIHTTAEAAEKQKQPTESVEDSATTVPRPRRRAAAAAASRVAEGFEEEHISVDKKRQDSEPAKRASKSRKKDVVARSTPESSTKFDNQHDDIATTTAKALPRKRAVTRKRKVPKEECVIESEVVQAVDLQTGELATNVALPTQNGTTRSRDHSNLTKIAPKRGCKSKGRKPAVKKRKRKSSMDAAERRQASTEHLSDAAPNSLAERQETFALNRAESKTRQKRHPLAEADMNITERSSSPEKAMQTASKEPDPLPKKNSRQPAKTLEHVPSSRSRTVASKKHKLNIKLETIENENQNAGTDSRGEHLKDLSSYTTQLAQNTRAGQGSLDWPATHDTRSADQQQGISTATQRRGNLIDNLADAKTSQSTQPFAEPKAQATKAPSGSSKARPISCEAGASASAHTVGPNVNRTAAKCADTVAEMRATEVREEDVDWLFAPQFQATAPKRPGVKAKSGNVGSKSSKFKMPEMDLDDLLSNIASFAQDESMPGTKNMTLFASGQQKPRCGSRKNAKS